MTKHVLPWLAGWFALFWVWQLMSGEWNRREWVAGAAAAALAATAGELARARAQVSMRPPWRAIAASWSVIPQVFVDFAIVMWALVRRRPGRTHTRRVDTRGSRAWTSYAANLSPNAYVIDMDDEHVTLHDLVANRRSESPA